MTPFAAMSPVDGPLPAGPAWVAEPKMDGWRALVTVADGTLRVRSRHGTDLTDRFPELQALAALGDAVLDGEVVVGDASGRPDFHALGQRRDERGPATLAVFDVLVWHGRTLVDQSYRQRRGRLEGCGLPEGAAVVVPNGQVDRMWAATRELGLEGVVAKRLDARYRCGRRSDAWVRRKHWRETTLHVHGYRSDGRGRVAELLVGDDATPRARVELGAARVDLDSLAALPHGPTGRDGLQRVAATLKVTVRHHGSPAQPRDAHLP